MTALYVLWLLLCLPLFRFALLVLFEDLREHGQGRSWSDCRCLDALDGLDCDCRIPAQRQPQQISGRY
jgi:hypothetical protein